MRLLDAIGHALSIAGSMTWEITWALILGFTLSAVVQAVVQRSTVLRFLGDDTARSLALATGLGAASSSCSYAAVALARSLFRKGAAFAAAMAFEIASTNLVIELGVILALLMGWQFTAAEFAGGPIMIVLLALMFRVLLRDKLLQSAREQAERGVAGSMEGHAAMDMSVGGSGSFWRRLASARGAYRRVSHLCHGDRGHLAGHRCWAADRRSHRRMGTGELLAALLLDQPSDPGQGVGPADWPFGERAELRLLDRQRAARGGVVERRHQLRRGDRVHLRRPDHLADLGHLP